LGYGFLEKVYERAMMMELYKNGISAVNQYPVKVYYEGLQVGEFYNDIVIEGCLACEIKASEFVKEEHELQLINFLKASSFEVGLLLNFGKVPMIRRKIYSNDRKIIYNPDKPL
jgi:GxxExxY protein